MGTSGAGYESQAYVVRCPVSILIAEHGLDMQVDRAGRDYVLIGIETEGDVIVGEHLLPIVVKGLDEDVHLRILHLYLCGVMEGHAKWCRRFGMAPANDAGSTRASQK